jgi:oleate hydratase
MTISEVHFKSANNGGNGLIHIQNNDILFLTLGSMTACSSLRSNTTAPNPLPNAVQSLRSPDGTWKLWASLADPTINPHFVQSGNPSNFYSRVNESNWLSFTATLKKDDFLNRLEGWTGNKAGTGALLTFKDSAWLMSILVPHQPHFLNQKSGAQVFWGYGLCPDKVGNFVNKSMALATGEDILTELLHLLKFPLEPTLSTSLVVPCMMPYITSRFLTRKAGDRPNIISEGSTSSALLGEYVEIPRDTVFTVEYSVRGAQIAVSELMRTEGPREVY